MPDVVLHSFGARVQLTAPAAVVDEVIEATRAFTTVEGRSTVDAHLVAGERDGRWTVSGSIEPISAGEVCDALVDRVHKLISVHARGVVFIHAGAVALGDQAVIIPGRSHTGKSTLVAAAVESGWRYFSDEFAVLGEHGLVHPYPRPLGLRDARGRARNVPICELGGVTATTAARAAAVVSTNFVPGARWAPRIVRGSAAALPIVDNAVRAQLDPGAVFRAAAGVVEPPCTTYVGARGEAHDTIDRLADLLEPAPL